MEQISLFDNERIYTQEDLNNAVVKALTDMSDVLERMSARIKQLEQREAQKNDT